MDLLSCPVSPSVKICIISCHIHNFVSVCNLKFLKNSKKIEKRLKKKIQKEFPENSKRVLRNFPKNSQKIQRKKSKTFPPKFRKKFFKNFSKKSQKILTCAYRSKSFSSLLFSNFLCSIFEKLLVMIVTLVISNDPLWI